MRRLLETVHISNNSSCDWRIMCISSVVALLIGSFGCASAGNVQVTEFGQPPSEKIDTHRVGSGETLYAIAWRYNMDVRQLASRNALRPPYRIYSGQVLALDLKAKDRHATQYSDRLVAVKSASDVTRPDQQGEAGNKKSLPSLRYNGKANEKWRWPVEGELLTGVNNRESRKQGFRGLNIAGYKGQPVLAARGGVVVYSGNGLKTLGNLLIVKHDEDYLSAYAHNSKLLVGRGDKVSVGQQIAELGSTGTNRNYLHFEIRYRGDPLDPLNLLPVRS